MCPSENSFVAWILPKNNFLRQQFFSAVRERHGGKQKAPSASRSEGRAAQALNAMAMLSRPW
ncbi:hypothetical protein KL86DPRO_10905 [uncultured delta proteobacterium]|uniref:Uncharacterized protein n=1 Tax=uncultured delta proteobacterium TaxID=34034 RepID=A0A212J854_9DELT|nr:hypothetical protein KL86DPRO_10905 [uncultured delta proteobacterium]